jgi:predicted lactoylglutathione lyase
LISPNISWKVSDSHFRVWAVLVFKTNLPLVDFKPTKKISGKIGASVLSSYSMETKAALVFKIMTLPMLYEFDSLA